MEFKEGLKILRRICAQTTDDCIGCMLNEKCPFGDLPYKWEDFEIDRAISVVEAYAEAHKPKTRLEVLTERFPNAHLDKGLPLFCPRTLFGGIDGFPCSGDHCEDCWNQIAPAEYQEDKP